MFAEIRFECKNKFPLNMQPIFASNLSICYDKKEAVKLIFNKFQNQQQIEELAKKTLYASLSKDHVYIVESPERYTLLVNVSLLLSNEDIPHLKRTIIDIMHWVRKLINDNGNKILKSEITIHSEDGTILQTGHKKKCIEMIRHRLGLKDFGPALTAAISSSFAYQYLSSDQMSSYKISTASALIVYFVVILGQLFWDIHKDEIDYEEG